MNTIPQKSLCNGLRGQGCQTVQKKKEERKDPILFKANDNLLIDILGHFHLNTSVCAPSLLFSQGCEWFLVDSRQQGHTGVCCLQLSTKNFFLSLSRSFFPLNGILHLRAPASDMPYCKRKRKEKHILSLVLQEVFHISVSYCFDCLSQYGRQYVHNLPVFGGKGESLKTSFNVNY